MQQCMKLSLTNRSSGLIPCSRAAANPHAKTQINSYTQHTLHKTNPVTRRPGGHSEGPPPDPIPNSAVKPLCANGTLSQDTGE